LTYKKCRPDDAGIGPPEGEERRHDGGHAGIENGSAGRVRFERNDLILQNLGVGVRESGVDQIHLLAFNIAGFVHILLVHEHHTTFIFYAAVAIFQSINSSIELIMRTGTCHHVFIIGQNIDR